jgi:hypothetical protein
VEGWLLEYLKGTFQHIHREKEKKRPLLMQDEIRGLTKIYIHILFLGGMAILK